MRITYILPVPSHVRFQKRISLLERFGIEARVLAFQREYYDGTRLTKALPTLLGRVENRDYIGRLGAWGRAIPPICAAIRDSDAVYAFGPDNAMLACAAKALVRSRAPLFYEVGDITPMQLEQSVRGRICRAVEEWLLRRTDLLVLTSEAYWRGYYRHRAGGSTVPWIVVENKPLSGDMWMVGAAEPPASEQGVRIGLFGVLRCPRTLGILKALSDEGSINVTLRGIPSKTLRNETQLYSYAYRGSYRVPEDLSEMYGSVDMVWIGRTKRPNVGNWSWARSNGFYEAGAFLRPMIAQVGTEDARVVEENEIGLSVDVEKPEEAKELLRSISSERLVKWRSNLERMPKSVFLEDGSDHLALAQVLKESAAQRC